MDYDQEYARSSAVFGTEAEATLKRFAHRLKSGAPVLDIGAGQGRNALYLARQGVAVYALEPSRVAASALMRVTETERLPVEVFSTTFDELEPPGRDFAGILIFGLIPDLPWSAIDLLIKKANDWSGPGTIIWVTGFTTDDPAYERHKTTWATIGANTFQSPEGNVRTYLKPGQILELFERFSVLHHSEGLGPEHRHGTGPPERHNKFEAVFRKVRA